MAPGDTARLYHRLSSYWYEPGNLELPPIAHPLVRADFATNHRPTFPAPTKSYPAGIESLELPDAWPTVDAPAAAVLAGTHEVEATGLDVAGVARILHLSAGVVRIATRRDGRVFRFRPAGSAGGLFPIELYLAARGVAGLDDGVWWYDPIGHALRRVGPSPDGEASALIASGIPWRTAWRYAERGYRHLCWDVGTMLAHTLALAESAGATPRLWTRFPDGDVARLIGADGIQELPLAVVGLGAGEPAIRPTARAEPGTIDGAPVEFPLITAVHHAGDLDRLGEPDPRTVVPVVAPRWSDDLDAVILRRGSARELRNGATVARQVLEEVLAVGLRGTHVRHFVAITAVDGVEPGLYRWPDLDHPIRTGDLRETLWVACWEQDLCRDGSAVVIAAFDIAAIDDRAYREAQVDAGIASGRMQLAAAAVGIGASAMSFLDSQIDDLLGEPHAGLLFTCLGVAPHRTQRAGVPRRPSIVATP